MIDGEKHYSDREIMSRWAIVRMNPAIHRILSARGLDDSRINGIIGFFYVDHDEGISLRIHAFCHIEPGQLPQIVVNFKDHGEDNVLRYDEFGAYTLLSNDDATELSFLSKDETTELSFLEEQRWCIYHEPEQLQAIRSRGDLDRFRAPGFFDDVSVILFMEDQEHIPEVVWVRLEGIVEDGTAFRGQLLNEPDADFGVHEGDMLTVRFAEHEDGRFLVAERGSVAKRE